MNLFEIVLIASLNVGQQFNALDLLYILWFFVLPILGLFGSIFVPIAWFVIVPAISRKLAYERFKKLSYHFIADDTGFAELVSTKEEIAEGVVFTKRGPRFLPRPRFLLGQEDKELKPTTEKTEETEDLEDTPILETKSIGLTEEEAKRTSSVEDLILRKFVWRQTGKPIWFGYAGNIASVNPVTVAGLQHKDKEHPLVGYLNKMKETITGLDIKGKPTPSPLLSTLETLIGKVQDLSKKDRGELKPVLKVLKEGLTDVSKSANTELLAFVENAISLVSYRPYKVVDLTKIKNVIRRMFTPSQVEAYGINREMRGWKKRGKELFPLILGGAIIIGLVILGIVALR